MKSNLFKLFSSVGLSSFLLLSSLGLLSPKKLEAQSLSGKPVLVFVDGYLDCCAHNMHVVRHGLATRFGAEIIDVTWDGYIKTPGRENWSGTLNPYRRSNDSAFTNQAPKLINEIDPNRPVILIGHSFGGDSILKILPRIKRSILFVGVIDPVAIGGVRWPIKSYIVPSNVRYFYNRWQQNALGAGGGYNLFPLDNRVVNGQISCNAAQCDQDAQNLARKGDGSPIKVPCRSLEVSCQGYQPWPGGSNGFKSRRLSHEEMPTDDYIQVKIRDIIDSLLR